MSRPQKIAPIMQTLKSLHERHQLANCVLMGDLEFDALRREQESIGVDIMVSPNLTYYGMRVIRVERTNYLRAATEY